MKKRLPGFVLIMVLMLGLSVSVFADTGGPKPPISTPPRSFSIDLNEAE